MEIGGAIQFPLPKIPIARPHITVKQKSILCKVYLLVKETSSFLYKILK
jgi:hypothetical protein